tara:strand:+ start:5940 stop:6665 length:726 start_codon:yes stop_codon:yes gene_type:complete
MQEEKITILIPARMDSTRFPGKPLAPIDGIPMIIYCARNAIKTGIDVYVCTDSKEIVTICDLYNIKSIITPECDTGTDRVSLAAGQLNTKYVINLQGDEPLIDANSLQQIIKMIPTLNGKNNYIINGVNAINSEEAFDPNNVKCALIKNESQVQYLSRKPLLNNTEIESGKCYYKQLGLYAMTYETLKEFSSLPKGKIESAERIEMMRWIENGNTILSCLIDRETISVDTPNDLVKVLTRK